MTAELLKFGGTNLWEVVVRVCREQWLLLIEAAPGAEVCWVGCSLVEMQGQREGQEDLERYHPSFGWI